MQNFQMQPKVGRKTKRKKCIRNSSYFNTRITHKKGRNYPLTSKNLEEDVDWKSTDGAYGILLQIILKTMIETFLSSCVRVESTT